MKRSYFDEGDIASSRKHFHRALFAFLFSLATLILFPALVFLFQSRETKSLFILFGSILTVAALFLAFFIGFVYLKPYWEYLRFHKEAGKGAKQTISAALEEVYSASSYRHGCYFRPLYFSLGEKKRQLFYVREDYASDFIPGRSYRLLTKGLFIFEMEEIEG